MNKVGAKRLLNVAKALRESSAPKLFTMKKYVWGEKYRIFNDDGYDSEKPKDREQKEREFCGTPACALGHYGARRDLQKTFEIKLKEHSDGPSAYLTASKSKAQTINCDGVTVCAHFDLDAQDAFRLFGPDGCGGAKTAVKAAAYIEKFVAKNLDQ